MNSILVTPSSKSHEQVHTNRPLTEQQIRAVFQNSVFGRAFDSISICGEEGAITTPSLTSQLLLLYYLLLYEDTRLSNSAAFVNAGRQVRVYSSEFMSELPIKYLLQQVSCTIFGYFRHGRFCSAIFGYFRIARICSAYESFVCRPNEIKQVTVDCFHLYFACWLHISLIYRWLKIG